MSAAHSLYPAFLSLKGIKVLVIGGGPVALRKVRTLVSAGAAVIVVAKEVMPALRRIKGVKIHLRAFRGADLKNARLIFAATNLPGLNTQIAMAARKQGAWVNVATPPAAGNLVVPSSIRRGKLCIAFSTGGASAAAAKTLRQELETRIDPAWGVLLDLLEKRRDVLKRTVADPRKRRKLLQVLGSPAWLQKVRKLGRVRAAQVMDREIARGIRGSKR